MWGYIVSTGCKSCGGSAAPSTRLSHNFCFCTSRTKPLFKQCSETFRPDARFMVEDYFAFRIKDHRGDWKLLDKISVPGQPHRKRSTSRSLRQLVLLWMLDWRTENWIEFYWERYEALRNRDELHAEFGAHRLPRKLANTTTLCVVSTTLIRTV